MIKLKVTGMTCDHCVRAVQQALAAVPGVEQVVEVNRHSGEAQVQGTAQADALVAAIVEEGYQAEVSG